MAEDKIFAKGFTFKRRDNAPDFVIGNLSLRADDAIEFIREYETESGWVNLQIKQAKGGNYYIELDTFKSSNSSEPTQSHTPAVTVYPTHSQGSSDLPF